MPTAGQVTNGANPLWWKGRFRPTSAQCPLVGAFRHSFHFFFYFSCINIFPPADGGGSSKNKSNASTSLKSGATITLLPASCIVRQHIFNLWRENLHAMINCLTKIFCKTSTSIVPKDTTDKKYVAMTGVWSVDIHTLKLLQQMIPTLLTWTPSVDNFKNQHVERF